MQMMDLHAVEFIWSGMYGTTQVLDY